MRGLPRFKENPQHRSVGRLDSIWPVLRGLWATESEARRQGRSGGVTSEQIWDRTLSVQEKPIDLRVVRHNLKVLAGRGWVAGEERERKLHYRSTTGEREAVEAELGVVFEYLLHGDPQLIELARRMLEGAKAPEAG